ncbi:MAG: flagellar filament capping protein FliD [Methylococcales bacterium]
MAVTTSLGVGSGIDIAGTVSQLTAAEGKPQLDAIAAKVNVSQTKLSGLGTLKGALSTFQNAVKMLDKSTTFQSQVITSSDEKVLKVSVDPSATAAAHTVKVNTLATAQRSVSTSEFKSTDVVNEGVLIFNDNTGAPKFSAIITKGTNDTLAGVRDAINNAKGNNSVVASLVNVDSKTTPGTTVSKLVLTAKTAGTANAFSVDTSLGDVRFNLNSVDTPANFNTTVATDTNVIIDAQPIAATSQRSIANKEFTSTDVVAPGMISFKDAAGVEKFSVNIIKGNNDKIFAAMDAINSNPANTIVTASVINVESKTTPGTSISKLVFTSKQPGVENKFSMDASKGDPLFTLDSSPANAQKSVASTVFSDTDLVAPGVLTIKDATGIAKFSVTIAADTTATLNADGTALAVGADGNPVLTDADGNPIPTITSTIKGNNTLADLRDAINYNPENKLVVASIATTTIDAVTTDSGTLDANGKPVMTVVTPASTTSKLVLTALEAGTEKGFAIDATAGDTRFALDPKVPSDPAVPATFVSSTTEATFDTTPAMAANDGGQSVTRTSNTISDAIPGVTLTLLTTGTATIDAHLDTPSIAQPISGFVDAYNKLNATLQQLTNYVGPGDANNGALLGDSTLQSIISQIKLTINSTVSSATGDYNSLNQLGVSFDKKGVMSLDSTKLNAALAGNLTSVANVFASTNGVATQLNTKITQYLDSKGALSTQQDSLNKTLTQLTTDKAAVNARLAATQKTLQAQYIAMDTAVSQFKNTGTFLTQALTPKTTA